MTMRLRIIAAIGWSIVLTSSMLGAFVDHACPFDPPPSPLAAYTIVDLGETDLNETSLTRQTNKFSLAPRLNENGVIIGNTSKGGFVTFPGRWMYAPQFEGMKINFHAINERGDLVVAVVRGQDSVEWMKWPYRVGAYGADRQHIHTIDPFVAKFSLAGFNDDGVVVGHGQLADCVRRPLCWDILHGLDCLGARLGLEIKGEARAINKNSTVVGIFDTANDRAPFVWNPSRGLLVQKNYRKLLEPTGWVEFADLLITDDQIVYGTYWIKHLAETHVVRGHYYESRQTNGSYYQYNAFMWKPVCSQIEMLDLQGMRLSAVNNCHVLVGSILSRAALCRPGKNPVFLDSLVDQDEVKGWNLIEITDINDQGQVVGYGWYQDKLHLFLANPLL